MFIWQLLGHEWKSGLGWDIILNRHCKCIDTFVSGHVSCRHWRLHASGGGYRHWRHCELEKVANNDALSVKPCTTWFHCQVKIFWATKSVCDALGMEQILSVGRNAGLISSRLWTKVHNVLRRCRRPLVVSNAFAQLCISCFIRKT